MGVVFAISAWVLLGNTVRSENVRALGKSTEQSGDWTAGDVALWAASLKRIEQRGTCQSDEVKAGLSLALKRLDVLQPSATPDVWAAAIGETRSYVVFALGCMPTNGNLWARRAMLDLEDRKPARIVLRNMALSQHYAPAEENVLGVRYRIWNTLPVQTLEQAASVVLADLRAICGEPSLRRQLPESSGDLYRLLEKSGDNTLKRPQPVKAPREGTVQPASVSKISCRHI